MAAERKADQVAQDLIIRIVSGALEVGSLLPKESELAEHYGVNRGVIREAIKLLEVHRLVRPVRRRGTEVLNPTASMSPEVLLAMLTPEPGKVNLELLSGILEARAMIDMEMSGLAAERRSDHDLQCLRDRLEDLKSALGSREAYTQAVDEFSLAVAQATKNPVFVMFVHWHHRVAVALRDAYLAIRPPTHEHWQGMSVYLQFIEDRDADGVQKLVSTFHQWASPRILAAAALANGQSIESALTMQERTNE